jgi:hypothetical protein
MKAERAQMSSPLQQKEEPIPGSSREKPSENVGGLTYLKTSDDLSTKSDKFNFGLRYYMGAEKIHDGNSIRSINLSIGYIVF